MHLLLEKEGDIGNKKINHRNKYSSRSARKPRNFSEEAVDLPFQRRHEFRDQKRFQHRVDDAPGIALEHVAQVQKHQSHRREHTGNPENVRHIIGQDQPESIRSKKECRRRDKHKRLPFLSRQNHAV